MSPGYSWLRGQDKKVSLHVHKRQLRAPAPLPKWQREALMWPRGIVSPKPSPGRAGSPRGRPTAPRSTATERERPAP